METLVPTFDVGDQTCGDGFTSQLRVWWNALPPGTPTVVTVRAASAKADLPSLARLLGHTVEQVSESDVVASFTIRTKGA